MFGDSKLGGKVEDKRSRVTQRKGGRSVASEKGNLRLFELRSSGATNKIVPLRNRRVSRRTCLRY